MATGTLETDGSLECPLSDEWYVVARHLTFEAMVALSETSRSAREGVLCQPRVVYDGPLSRFGSAVKWMKKMNNLAVIEFVGLDGKARPLLLTHLLTFIRDIPETVRELPSLQLLTDSDAAGAAECLGCYENIHLIFPEEINSEFPHPQYGPYASHDSAVSVMKRLPGVTSLTILTTNFQFAQSSFADLFSDSLRSLELEISVSYTSMDLVALGKHLRSMEGLQELRLTISNIGEREGQQATEKTEIEALINSNERLTRLGLYGKNILDGDFLGVLGILPRLERLEINDYQPTIKHSLATHVKQLGRIRDSCTSLRELVLGRDIVGRSPDLEEIAKFSALTSVELEAWVAWRSGMDVYTDPSGRQRPIAFPEAAAGLAGMKSLTKLVLTSCDTITEAAINSICKLRLQHLELSDLQGGLKHDTDGESWAGADFSVWSSTLVVLCLRQFVTLGPQVTDNLCNLTRLRKLEIVALPRGDDGSGYWLQDSDLERISRSLVNLRSLKLGSTDITTLMPLSSWDGWQLARCLCELTLFDSPRLTLIEAIAHVKPLQQLRVLNLSDIAMPVEQLLQYSSQGGTSSALRASHEAVVDAITSLPMLESVVLDSSVMCTHSGGGTRQLTGPDLFPGHGGGTAAVEMVDPEKAWLEMVASKMGGRSSMVEVSLGHNFWH